MFSIDCMSVVCLHPFNAIFLAIFMLFLIYSYEVITDALQYGRVLRTRERL